jgi:hypothetical protein
MQPVVAATPPAPGTTQLLGGSVDTEEHSGGRFTLGYWFDPEQTFGVDGGFFFLGTRRSRFTAASTGNPMLTVPYLDVTTGKEGGLTVASPSQTTITNFTGGEGLSMTTATAGHVSATLSSRLWGAEVDADWGLACGDCYRLTLLGGFRYLNLKEDLGLAVASTQTQSFTSVDAFGTPFASATTTTISFRQDDFATHNDFYGGQLGGRAEFNFGRLSFDMLGQVALGSTHEVVDIAGFSNIAFTGTRPASSTSFGGTVPAQSSAFQQQLPGGIFAQPSNIGLHSTNVFAVVPEFDCSVGFQITQRLKAAIGYSLLYWSAVARPVNQLDRSLDPASFVLPQVTVQTVNGVQHVPVLPGPVVPASVTQPAFGFHDSAFWTQGLTFSLAFRF